jgi:hypothetical protein
MMKLPVALGVALAALTVAAASAHSTSRHVIVRGGHSAANLDADQDGWITRAEASSAFERIFADLDSNDDGKLDDQDRREIRVRVDGPDVRVLEGGRNVRVIRRGDGDDNEVRVITGDALDAETEARIEREIEEAMERAEEHIERAEREAERAARQAERAERDAERAARRVRVERHGDDGREIVIIRSHGGEWTDEDGGVMAIAPVPPVPPVPPIAPHFMMLIANSEEADANGDGALSLEEFRNQHLRFFDASDANGDGRVRFERPPEPPAPPAPPEPPRRR